MDVKESLTIALKNKDYKIYEILGIYLNAALNVTVNRLNDIVTMLRNWNL